MESKALGLVAVMLLRGIAWFLYLLPRRVRLALGDTLGFVFRVFGFRAQVMRKNLDYAYPGDTAAVSQKRDEIFRDVYSHLGNLILELFFLFGPLKRVLEKEVDFVGLEHFEKARRKGKGILFLGGHFGNWEIMAAKGAAVGIPVMLVTKTLKPAWLHEAIVDGRNRVNVAATYEPRTLKDVLSHLKKNGAVGVILDQYTGPPVSVRVPFFGIPVGTHTALATLARRTEAVLLPVVNRRLPDGRHRVEIFPAIEWITHEEPFHEIAQNTAQYARVLESWIYQVPGQWLWTHRRFKGDLSPLRPEEWFAGRARK